MPFVEKEKYQLSTQCRLHPSNDIFRDQEEHKIHVDIHDWRCGYCKKVFRAEKYLDQHFDNRHYNLLNVVCDSVFAFLILLNDNYGFMLVLMVWLYVSANHKWIARVHNNSLVYLLSSCGPFSLKTRLVLRFFK